MKRISRGGESLVCQGRKKGIIEFAEETLDGKYRRVPESLRSLNRAIPHSRSLFDAPTPLIETSKTKKGHVNIHQLLADFSRQIGATMQ